MQTDSTGLLTDKYELTMIEAALAAGTAERQCVFEVFARRLPSGRRYGVVAGTARLLDALQTFHFGPQEIAELSNSLNPDTLKWLSSFRFTGDIDGYPEGEVYFPDSPLLQVRGTFAECVLLETLALSILNFDSAVAAAAARMAIAAGEREVIEMGSRRCHEYAAVAAARAAYIAGFGATSNVEAGRRYGVPVTGTAAHSFTLLHTTPAGPDEAAAFRSQVAAFGPGTTLLVDTYDIPRGVKTAIEIAGTELGAVRIDSGDLGVMARQVRQQLDQLGAHNTRIIVSGDLDEYAIAALRAEPVDAYGAGTKVVTGSGAPTAGLVYKLVEVDGVPVAKRSFKKESAPGAKTAVRTSRESGTAVEELIFRRGQPVPDSGGLFTRPVIAPMVRSGEVVCEDLSLQSARIRRAEALVSLPWEGLALSDGDPALSVRIFGK